MDRLEVTMGEVGRHLKTQQEYRFINTCIEDDDGCQGIKVSQHAA